MVSPVPPEPSGRRPLSRDRIVESALDLARREGVDGLSMRRLAGELGVEAMSLYRYVPSKASLMTLMADRSISRMAQPDPSLPWHRQLVELTVQTYVAATDNPALFPVLAAEPMHPDALPVTHRAGAATIGLLEQYLRLLEEAQLPLDVRVHALRGLVGLMVGFVAGQVDGLLPKPAAADRPTPGDEHFRADTAPRLTAMRPALTAADPVEGLRFSVQLFLQGLQELAMKSSPSATAATADRTSQSATS